MISEAFKVDTGMFSRLRGYKPNTTLTSLNLSGFKTENIIFLSQKGNKY